MRRGGRRASDLRYGDTRGEGPRVGRRQHAQRRLALRRPARVRRSDGRRNAGGWRCRVILCMICTRSTPPSRPMVHRSLARPLSSSLAARGDDDTASATSLQRVRCITFGGFLQGPPLGSTPRRIALRRWQPSILFSRRKCTWVSKAKPGDSYDRFDLYDFNTSAGLSIKTWLKNYMEP